MHKSIKPGKFITIERTRKINDRETKVREKWKVIKVYSHHVLCKRNNIKESFNIGDLVTYGVIEPDAFADRFLSENAGLKGIRKWHY